MGLKQQLIKLAHNRPELRPEIAALLRKASGNVLLAPGTEHEYAKAVVDVVKQFQSQYKYKITGFRPPVIAPVYNGVFFHFDVERVDNTRTFPPRPDSFTMMCRVSATPEHSEVRVATGYLSEKDPTLRYGEGVKIPQAPSAMSLGKHLAKRLQEVMDEPDLKKGPNYSQWAGKVAKLFLARN